MPHLIFEHSSNIQEDIHYPDLLKSLHEIVSQLSVPSAIKSRAICHDHFRVGNGEPDRAFVHITVLLLTGRDHTQKKKLGEDLLSFLKEKFSLSYKNLNCDFTIAVEDINRDVYTKENSG
ncbi:Uncharacterized protein SCG7109_AB_00370 [Chlamydiales bacterium SCGC AG-110-M15]|nr:Uncharacterized protein SCG7109_AB_00370 [Chlamydiales bacterium SCGC AG-110-M15]